MNTGAEDDSLSTPTFAFGAVWALASLSEIIAEALTSANAARMQTALAIIVMNLVPSPGGLYRTLVTKSPVIPGRSGPRRARPDGASPESITTIVSMDS